MTALGDGGWQDGVFGDPEAAAIWAPPRQIAHMLAFEAALTRALGRVGTVPPGVAEDLAQRIMRFDVDAEALRRGSAVDGVPVPALVAQLRAMAGNHASAVHAGATSQDVLDTALALTLREVNVLLQARLAQVIRALDDLHRRFGARGLMGRTRMQAALPMTVADRLRNWAEPLGRHADRLDQIRATVEVLQLGGAVGDRAALAPHAAEIAAHMARDLGLGNPAVAWHGMRDGLAEHAGLLSLITGTLGKMGQDICLMAQQGLDEIDLGAGGGSSAMPHKRNPVLAELLVTLARFNAVQIGGMHHALIHEQERSGAAWMLEWLILPDMARTTARSLGAASDLLDRIKAVGGR